MKTIFWCLLALLTLTGAARAQTGDVYVTVQDNAVLRAGPGPNWEPLATLPFGTTYRASGRTIDGDWLQIAYEGELHDAARTEFTNDGVTYGWVASWLLVWTGNVLELPVDGMVAVPIARAAGPTIVVGPNSFVYEGVIDPTTRVPSPATSPVTVEVTGRLGSVDSGYFWLQFKLGGKYYWTGSWAVGVPRGYSQLPDAAYLYPYSRLTQLLIQNTQEARAITSNIGDRWYLLSRGQPVTCNDIPDDLVLKGFSPADLTLEPTFAPTAIWLNEAQTSINAALAQFRVVCEQEQRQLTPDMIQSALIHVDTAVRNLTLLGELLVPFQQHDPVLSPDE